jgi:hypothetical protein
MERFSAKQQLETSLMDLLLLFKEPMLSLNALIMEAAIIRLIL